MLIGEVSFDIDEGIANVVSIFLEGGMDSFCFKGWFGVGWKQGFSLLNCSLFGLGMEFYSSILGR